MNNRLLVKKILNIRVSRLANISSTSSRNISANGDEPTHTGQVNYQNFLDHYNVGLKYLSDYFYINLKTSFLFHSYIYLIEEKFSMTLRPVCKMSLVHSKNAFNFCSKHFY